MRFFCSLNLFLILTVGVGSREGRAAIFPLPAKLGKKEAAGGASYFIEPRQRKRSESGGGKRKDGGGVGSLNTASSLPRIPSTAVLLLHPFSFLLSVRIWGDLFPFPVFVEKWSWKTRNREERRTSSGDLGQGEREPPSLPSRFSSIPSGVPWPVSRGIPPNDQRKALRFGSSERSEWNSSLCLSAFRPYPPFPFDMEQRGSSVLSHPPFPPSF